MSCWMTSSRDRFWVIRSSLTGRSHRHGRRRSPGPTVRPSAGRRLRRLLPFDGAPRAGRGDVDGSRRGVVDPGGSVAGPPFRASSAGRAAASPSTVHARARLDGGTIRACRRPGKVAACVRRAPDAASLRTSRAVGTASRASSSRTGRRSRRRPVGAARPARGRRPRRGGSPSPPIVSTRRRIRPSSRSTAMLMVKSGRSAAISMVRGCAQVRTMASRPWTTSLPVTAQRPVASTFWQ